MSDNGFCILWLLGMLCIAELHILVLLLHFPSAREGVFAAVLTLNVDLCRLLTYGCVCVCVVVSVAIDAELTLSR